MDAAENGQGAMMKRQLTRLGVILAALSVLPGLTCGAFAQTDEHIIFAGVVDASGNPVSGLTEKDFIVREDGQAREILRVAKDEDQLQIALLVDNSVVLRNRLADLRRALATFIDALRPNVQLSIVTLAERPTIVVPYTTDRGQLKKGADRIIALEAGNYMLDAIAEVSQGLAKRPNARSIIAIVSGRGPEYSYREYTDVLRIVRESGTPSLHAMMIGGMDADVTMQRVLSGNPADGADRLSGAERDIVLGRLTRDTGGRYEEVLAMSALASKLQQLSAELSNQYRVTFARPQRLIPPEKTEISARDPKLTARGRLATAAKPQD
jgi:VWFA-related protein